MTGREWSNGRSGSRTSLVLPASELEHPSAETLSRLGNVPWGAVLVLTGVAAEVPGNWPERWTIHNEGNGLTSVYTLNGTVVIEDGNVYIQPLEGERVAVNSEGGVSYGLLVIEPMLYAPDIWTVLWCHQQKVLRESG